VCALVFVIIAAVMFFGHKSRQRVRKREAEANAKIAELQDQVEEAHRKNDEPAI
jgi:predicted negative regulator of RcsB-dependent stress response